MNKCAKFHKDSPSDKTVKINLPSAIELSETAVFVYNKGVLCTAKNNFFWAVHNTPLYNFVKKRYASEELRWHIWPTFPLNFFMKFSQKMRLYFFYTIVQKSQKWPKTQIKGGGSCLNTRSSVRLLLSQVYDQDEGCKRPVTVTVFSHSIGPVYYWFFLNNRILSFVKYWIIKTWLKLVDIQIMCWKYEQNAANSRVSLFITIHCMYDSLTKKRKKVYYNNNIMWSVIEERDETRHNISAHCNSTKCKWHSMKAETGENVDWVGVAGSW